MADPDSRRERTGFLKSEIRGMLLLLAFGEFAGIGAAVWTRHAAPELSHLFATAATTLLFGSLLGGIVTLLIAEFDRRRVQRAAQLDFIANVLTDLKDVHDQVDRCQRPQRPDATGAPLCSLLCPGSSCFHSRRPAWDISARAAHRPGTGWLARR